MVQSCCNNCYKKYISKNNDELIIDEKFLVNNFGKKYEIVVEPDQIDKSLKEFILSKDQELPTSTYVLINKKKTKLCMCPCHMQGTNIFH